MPGKPGKRGGGGGGTTEDGADAAVSSRLTDLKDKVARTAELIAGLRESNHALKGEVAELSRKLAALEASPPEAAGPSPDPEPSLAEEADASRERDRLVLLLQERKTIRRKVEKLLERVGRLES
jgi:hypothetical protein